METMSQFNSQEANAIRDKKLKPVQLNCLYCIIKCERHSVALYYLVKEGDQKENRDRKEKRNGKTSKGKEAIKFVDR